MLRFHVEALELPADQVREECGDGGIDEAHPEHVSGDGDSEERNGTRKVPEDEGEASDCEDGIEEADEEVDGKARHRADVLRDALVRVVGLLPAFAEQIMRAPGREPPGKENLRYFAAKREYQPVLEVSRPDEENDDGRREADEV